MDVMAVAESSLDILTRHPRQYSSLEKMMKMNLGGRTCGTFATKRSSTKVHFLPPAGLKQKRKLSASHSAFSTQVPRT